MRLQVGSECLLELILLEFDSTQEETGQLLQISSNPCCDYTIRIRLMYNRQAQVHFTTYSKFGVIQPLYRDSFH